MNTADEKARFRRQFDENQWTILIEDQRFLAAWQSDDLARAAEMATIIFYGTANKADERKDVPNSTEDSS